MSRQRLADFTKQINSGIYKDPANNLVPLWSDGKNIVFDPEGPRPVHGFSSLALNKPAGLPVRGMIQSWITGNKYIFFGNKNNLYKYDDGLDSITEVSKATDAYSAAFWSFDNWGDWVLATNDAEVVQVYKDTVGDFADLSTDIASLTAPIVVTTRAHAIFFGTDAENREITWSDEDDVTVYTPQISNAAGSLYVRSLASPIRAAANHPSGILFYGDSSVHLLRWVGPPYYFGEQRLYTNIGALGKYAVVHIKGTHFGIGSNGIWSFSPGQEPQYIDRPQIHNYVFDDLDHDNAEKTVAWYDENQDLLVISYPSKEDGQGEPTRSVAMTLATGGWSPLDFAASAAAESPVFQYTSAGDYLGNAYWHGIPGAGGGGSADQQAFISITDDLQPRNYYGLSGYGQLGYGGP